MESGIKGDWKEIKSLIKTRFEKLNDSSIEAVKDNMELLSEKLQSAYGYAKEHAEKEVSNFKASLHAATKPETKSDKVETMGKVAVIAFALCFFGACSSTPKVQEFPPTANATEELQRFTADMDSARERQVNVLSPSVFKNAEKALKTASQDQSKGEESKDVLHEIAIGRAHLERANTVAEISRTNLEAAVMARQAAITAGAPKLYSEAFNDADDHLRDVTSEIEDNDLSDVADNRAKLQKEYLDVELKSIKQTNLGPAQLTIAAAIKEGAKDYAKQSLAIAEKNVTDSEEFITANRHQTDAVKARSEAATRAADHLLKITRASKEGKNVSSEQAALNLESEQLRTQEKTALLSAAKNTAKGLARETSDLRATDKFNRSFESVRSEFTKDEAEVYRQEDQLVIRLRTLEFPANQSVLKGSNFPVLAKLAKVIKGFDGSAVVIEGHTDSDGSKELNTKLSTERAQAISDYLVSNNAINAEKISVVGYGYDRPLATNKTAKGKAQNRRVDILITPLRIAE